MIASKDETASAVIESNMLPEVVEGIADFVVSEGTAEIVGAIVGALAPRINGIRLNYKQNRFEKSVTSALALVAQRIDKMETNYSTLEEEIQEKFRGIYVEWLLDNLEEEKQIDVLSLYNRESQENIISLCNRYNLKIEQVAVIKEKLERLGLIYSKNDEQRDGNIDSIVDYLNKVDKEQKKSKPKGIRLPNIKKPNRSPSYAITSLGRDYLRVISD